MNSQKSNFNTGITSLLRQTERQDFVLAFLSSTLSGAFIFSLLMRWQPLQTLPVSLSGYYAYTHDINITNRLFSVSVFLFSSLLLFLPALKLWHDLPRPQKAHALKLSAYSQLPSVIWLSSILLNNQEHPQLFWLGWAGLSVWLIPLLIKSETKNQKRTGTAELFMLTLCLSFFVIPALLVLLRSGLMLNLPGFRTNAQEMLTAITAILQKIQFLPPLMVCLIYACIPGKNVLCKWLLFPIQLCLLLFFTLALPGVFRTNIEVVRFFSIGRPFLFIVLPLMLLGLISCIRLTFFTKQTALPLSAFSLLALLIFFFFSETPLPGFSAYNMVDNFFYEFGHRYSTIWMSLQKGARLFVDVQDSWGLWDSFQFQLGWFLTGTNTAASSAYGQFLFNLLLLCTQFLLIYALYRNALIACVLTFFFGYDVSAAMVIYFVIIFYPPLLQRRWLWLILWAALSMFFPFFKNPQGSMLVAGSLPLCFWQLWRLFKENKRQLALTMVPLFIMALMLLFWPFGDSFRALVEMFLETGSINADWGAVDWYLDSHSLLEGLIGNLLIVLPTALLLITILIWRSTAEREQKGIALLLCLSAFLITLISLSYSFSRTDYAVYCRQFNMLSALVFAAGCVLTAMFFNQKNLNIYVLVLLALNLLLGHFPSSPVAFNSAAANYPFISESKIIDAEAEYGLRTVGKGVFPRAYIEEESRLKEALDTVLDPEESFLNLTLNGSHYYISERMSPTEYSTYYDFVGEESELRAINEMERSATQTSLVDPTMLEFSPSNFRTYHLYRYAVLDRYPWQINETKAILMPAEKFAKAGLSIPDDRERLEILDEFFPQDIWQKFPSVLGRNADQLLAEAVPFQTDYQSHQTADASVITFAQPLDGSQAGLLSFDLDISGAETAQLQIEWTNADLPDEINSISFEARNGRILVPLDCAPRWLLSENISEIRLSAQNENDTALEVKIDTVALYQRGNLI